MGDWQQVTKSKGRGRGRGSGGQQGGQQSGQPQQQQAYAPRHDQGGAGPSRGQPQQTCAPRRNQGGPGRGNDGSVGDFSQRRGGGQQGAFRGSPRGGEFSGGQRGGYGQSPPDPMPKPVVHKQIIRQKLTPGTAAIKQFRVLANFYQIAVSDVIVIHYDVNITALKKKLPKKGEKSPALEEVVDEKAEMFIKKFSPEILDAFKADHPEIFGKVHTIFDGYKNLYSIKELAILGNEFTQEAEIKGRKESFKIKIRRVETIDLSQAQLFYDGRVSEIPERVFSVLEIIFKSLIIEAGYVSYQRKYFDLQDSQRSNMKIHEFVRGFLGAVQMTEFGLALNVHLKATCIISKSYSKLTPLVTDVLGIPNERELESRPLQRWQLDKVNKIIADLLVFTCHTKNKMSFKVKKLVLDTPYTHTFTKDNKEITTAKYFFDQYKINLLNLPMVLMSKKETYIPLELVYLTDKQFVSHRKVNAELQEELLAFATMSPNIYFNRANKIVNRAHSSSAAMAKEFGLDSFSLQPVAINARQIQSPSMKSAGSKDILHVAKPPMYYAIVCFDSEKINQITLDKFLNEMRITANEIGLKLPDPQLNVIRKVSSVTQVEDVCKEIITKVKNLDMLFFGVPKKSQYYRSVDNKGTEEIYNTVKHFFDQKYGIISQGIDSKNILNIKRGYFNNLLLKVNGKYGGQNAVIDPASLGTIKKFNPNRAMIVGVDVFHAPVPNDKNDGSPITSSIAAATGSYDHQHTKYSCSIRVQHKNDKDKDKEMIRQMDQMIEELLIEYQGYNKAFPESIFIFRDGVSEGQLEKLSQIEIPLVEKAIIKVIGKMIKLSLIVVQKRHHTRFVRAEMDTTPRKPTYNVPKGTVVDTMIVDPTHEEFYLASHDSPLGTTKPTKYIKIRDDLRLSTDDLQKLCFYVCHQSIRTRNPISIPVMVRYADLAAYRSGLHIRAQMKRQVARSFTSTLDAEKEIISNLNKFVKVNDKLKMLLYYS